MEQVYFGVGTEGAGLAILSLALIIDEAMYVTTAVSVLADQFAGAGIGNCEGNRNITPNSAIRLD